MGIEGRLQIELRHVAGRVNRVCIQSSRPLRAARIFEGRTPQEVLMQLPLLYSICGTAQAAAAGRAMQQALAQPASLPVEAARGLLVTLETAREHLWRILIGWPVLMDEAAHARQAAPLAAMVEGLRHTLFVNGEAFSLQAVLQVDASGLDAHIRQLEGILSARIFGCPAREWLRIRDEGALRRWSRHTETVPARLLNQVIQSGWAGAGAVAAPHLPDLPVASLDQRLGAPDANEFIARPLWNGMACETTALTRQYEFPLVEACRSEQGDGLLTRLVARLVELARLPAAMRRLTRQLGGTGSVSHDVVLPEGVGIGQVEAARGRLVHRVVLDDGHVQCYQILAPTEWNFHPRGVLAQGLESLQEAEEVALQGQAAMLVDAIDPCVGYELRVH